MRRRKASISADLTFSDEEDEEDEEDSGALGAAGAWRGPGAP
jgi:hypothetical protein